MLNFDDDGDECIATSGTSSTKMKWHAIYPWYVALVAATCYIIDGYDNAVFNAVQGSAAWMAYAGHPTPAMLGNLHTVYCVTAIFAGFFCAGPLSKYTGRRVPMIIAAISVIIATMLQIFQPRGKIALYFAGRIFAAFAQGLVVPIAPTYIAEVAPAAVRGRMLVLWQLFCSVGQFTCFIVSFTTSRHHRSLPPEWDWKIIILFQLLAPLVILINVPFIPESPRWLVQKGKMQKAKVILQTLRHNDKVAAAELEQIIDAIEHEKRTASAGAYAPLWKDTSLRRRFLIACGLFAGQQLCCQGSLNNYSTMIYKRVFSRPDIIQLINAINASIAILATLISLSADRVGRRPLLLIGSFGMSFLLVCAATLYVASPTLANGTKPVPIGAGIVTTFYLFVIHYKPSWGATTWILASEMFSLNVRPHAVGMSSQIQNALNVVIGQVFPIVFSKIHFYIFYIFAGFAASMCVCAFFFIPETKGLSLEDMGRAFGQHDRSDKDAIKEASGDEDVEEKDKYATADLVPCDDASRAEILEDEKLHQSSDTRLPHSACV